jgi:hypothetical protein
MGAASTQTKSFLVLRPRVRGTCSNLLESKELRVALLFVEPSCHKVQSPRVDIMCSHSSTCDAIARARMLQQRTLSTTRHLKATCLAIRTRLQGSDRKLTSLMSTCRNLCTSSHRTRIWLRLTALRICSITACKMMESTKYPLRKLREALLVQQLFSLLSREKGQSTTMSNQLRKCPTPITTFQHQWQVRVPMRRISFSSAKVSFNHLNQRQTKT